MHAARPRCSGFKRIPEIDLEVAGGARSGEMVVQTPHAAVGQKYPHLIRPIRLDLRRRQVPKYLAMRRPRPAPAVRAPRIQRQPKPLALLDHPGISVTLPGAASSPPARSFEADVHEQQMVRDILVS